MGGQMGACVVEGKEALSEDMECVFAGSASGK